MGKETATVGGELKTISQLLGDPDQQKKLNKRLRQLLDPTDHFKNLVFLFDDPRWPPLYQQILLGISLDDVAEGSNDWWFAEGVKIGLQPTIIASEPDENWLALASHINDFKQLPLPTDQIKMGDASNEMVRWTMIQTLAGEPIHRPAFLLLYGICRLLEVTEWKNTHKDIRLWLEAVALAQRLVDHNAPLKDTKHRHNRRDALLLHAIKMALVHDRADIVHFFLGQKFAAAMRHRDQEQGA